MYLQGVCVEKVCVFVEGAPECVCSDEAPGCLAVCGIVWVSVIIISSRSR